MAQWDSNSQPEDDPYAVSLDNSQNPKLLFTKQMGTCRTYSFKLPESPRSQRSQKCLCQSEVRAAILVFQSAGKKHKLGRGYWNLAFCEVLNSIQRFKRKNLPQPITCQGGHLVFPISPKKLGRWHWDLASCRVWLNSVLWFQRRSRKCEKLKTTDDGQRIVEPSALVH